MAALKRLAAALGTALRLDLFTMAPFIFPFRPSPSPPWSCRCGRQLSPSRHPAPHGAQKDLFHLPLSNICSPLHFLCFICTLLIYLLVLSWPGMVGLCSAYHLPHSSSKASRRVEDEMAWTAHHYANAEQIFITFSAGHSPIHDTYNRRHRDNNLVFSTLDTSTISVVT
ncbi:hypothetical protein BJV74DRAFT_367733 [Russula compacta]|nr:hypothetical protein BJV74DRAFT_367733 [Russula compacta]